MPLSRGARPAAAKPLFRPVTPGRWWSTALQVVSKSAPVCKGLKRPALRKDLTQASEESALVSERTNSQDQEDLERGGDGADVRAFEARDPAGDLAQAPADDVVLTTLRWASEGKASVAARELDFATRCDAARLASVEGSAYVAALKDLRTRYEETEASMECERTSPANTEYLRRKPQFLRAKCEIAEGQAEQLRLRAEHAGAPDGASQPSATVTTPMKVLPEAIPSTPAQLPDDVSADAGPSVMAFLKYALKSHPVAESIAREGLEAEELTDLVALKNWLQAASLKDQLRHMRAGTDREAMEVQELTTEAEAHARNAAADDRAVDEIVISLQEAERKAAASMQAAAADARAVEETKKVLEEAERKATASMQAAATDEHAVEETKKARQEAEQKATASMQAAEPHYAKAHHARQRARHNEKVIPAVFNCLTNCRASTARGFARPRSDVEQASEGETKTKKHRAEQPDDTTEQLLACLGPHVQVHTAPAQSRQHILPPLGYRDENSPRPAVKPIAALPTTPQPMPSSTEGSTARVSSTPRCKSTSRVSPNLLL
jgi:hypothetical protein